MPRYSINIHSMFIAPEHRVFGKGNAGNLNGADLKSIETARILAHSGIEGDRFCRDRPEYNGHVTFFSLEAWNEISLTLDLPKPIGPEIARRNIVVSGIDLKALYGAAFTIQDIQFLGTTHCAPCLAMNRALGPGAREAMRSRGGLRAQVKSSGALAIGPCELTTSVLFDPKNAGSQTRSPRIP